MSGDRLDFIRELVRGVEVVKVLFHRHGQGDIRIDAQQCDRPAFLIMNVDGAGFQDFSVLRSGQVAKPVFESGRIAV